LCSSRASRSRRNVAGFTLIEVLVALAVIGISLAAIGSLVATTVRGIRSVDQHLALVETARAIEAALPDRGALDVGSFDGETGGHRWSVSVSPLQTDVVDPRLPTPWVPQSVMIRVQSPAGPIFQINTVRLRRGTGG
jgi:general secretion pathway protein I